MPPTSSENPENRERPAPKSSAGPAVGAVIIVLLLLIGALYLWQEWTVRKNASPIQITSTTTDSTTTLQ